MGLGGGKTDGSVCGVKNETIRLQRALESA
jgi:hypothetical protein